MTTAIETDTAASATMDGRGAVRLEGVTKRYGDAVAVDDLSLSIEPGEFISFLGPSGCGKTTTLRMIAGFEHPDAGSISISGASVLNVPPYRRDVNTVFQAYALFPHRSVAENVAYGLQQRRTPKAEVRERVSQALDMVQMRHLADRKPTQLSGGQQQRVALARALVNRPAVLLLDEPLGALDRQLREEMQLELKLLQSRLGITFVFVTHDQGEALSMSDRIAIMRAGRIEQLADADTVYARPASAYVAAFVGQQNFFHGDAAESGAAVASPHALVRGTGTELAGVAKGEAAVRPEFISIEKATAGSASDANTARGELIGVSHLGDTMQFLVRLGDEQSLIVRRPTPEAPSLRVGDDVLCSWSAQNVLLFPSDDSAEQGGYIAPPTH
ncbi:ABC transporter ATP-binding protein [Microbacterium thalassium]|uniref:Spermidine/putrescine import ATP-binding protein PotA n=1 Tax=Microbacterium thalassium TaxID=362649 RepID=A0A7X0KUB2_9MICO|nr:ABC transporter ATP-binding protein [Microbacterium thalassium]MBB6390949.1 spermidine/putrescine ABC transporter ATP-binding subunit [Microbacterium thalassium]GLK26058.1 polyamine-transporting ATPase [Microbacterium thalassium]